MPRDDGKRLLRPAGDPASILPLTAGCGCLEQTDVLPRKALEKSKRRLDNGPELTPWSDAELDQFVQLLVTSEPLKVANPAGELLAG